MNSTTPSADEVRALPHTDDVQQRAIDALTSGQETFSRAQVAYLMHLAVTAALDGQDDDTGQAATDLAYRAGYAAGFAAGEDSAFGEVHADLRYALGGPAAKTMAAAVKTAQAAIDRQHARADWDRRAREDRPHGLMLDDPNWPPVAIPGQPARHLEVAA
ncbi:hypothetical protein [Micromonospora carbonacea]|uniref:Uncharacterized protein n=1 Tax=Micromonospora carbonacea TaxID=47853 RepID=A0A1C5AYU8_9ACTN|nr:hypothetical protein [Micromonospora carbonacea]SCF50395.1 hypothetical protein GA0070563_13120 [Micromonospora carbonacea]